MKTIVIYESKTGFTQKYAQWIAEDLGCESLPAAQTPRHDLSPYDLIIYGGPVRGGGILGRKKFRRLLDKFPKVQPVLFACGMALESDDENMKNLKKQNLIGSENDRIPLFFLRGGFDVDRMGFLTRLIMKPIALQMRKAVPADEIIAHPDPFHVDCTSREAIQPLVAWVKAQKA